METVLKILRILFHFEVDQQSEHEANDSVAKFAQNAMRQLRSIGEVAAAIAFDKVVQNLLKATSQAEDTAFVFENIYGELSDSQAAWAEEFADTYNRSATKVKESLSTIQHEMIGFTKAGTDEQRKNVAEMSKLIEEAGLNLGAYYGMDAKTAINTLISATEGSDAAMQTFNVGEGKQVVAKRHEAMRELRNEGQISGYRSYENLSLYEKSLVNLRTVMNANKDATDALARSQGNYSTMQQNLRESLEELKELLGEFFLPTAKKITDFIITGIRFVNDSIEVIKKVTDALGLTEPLLNAVAMLLAVIVATKVISWAAGVVGAIKSIGAAVLGLAGTAGAATATIMAQAGLLIGILAVIMSVVSDLNKFLKGEDSTTGTIISKLGIDAEKAKPFIEGLRNVIMALTIALGALKVASIVTGTALMATPVGWIIAGIAALIAVIVTLVKHWDKVKSAVTGAFEAVKNAITSVFDWIKEKISKVPDWALALSSIFLGPIGPIILLIRHFDKLKEAARKAWEWVKKIFGGKGNRDEAKESGRDMVEGMAEGIEEGQGTLAASAESAAETVADYTHFSLPKKGPLSDFDKSMPDMIDIMVGGVQKGRVKLAQAVSGLAGSLLSGLSNLTALGTPLGFGTLALAAGTSGGGTMLTQHITFNQEFNGPEAMEQKVVRASTESVDDITKSVARALDSSI